MTEAVELGDTFLVPSGPSGSHFFVVCTGENADGFRLLVSISTVREGRFYDPACLIDPGAHPFVKSLSFVSYSKAEQRLSDHILRCLEQGVFIRKPAASPELVEQIIAGIERSEFTRNWVFDFLADLA